MLTFPQEEFVVYLDTPTESKSEPDVVEKQYVAYQDLRLPRWGGSDNNIIQKNTCALDNILAILSIFKENITNSYPVIGTTHLCEKNFNRKCMIGSIGCIITNLEYSICAKLLPSRCQHYQTTITDSAVNLYPSLLFLLSKLDICLSQANFCS